MKKIIVFCTIVCSLVSCSLNNDPNPDFHFEILPIESVEIPDEFVFNETYDITVHYIKPSSCYSFSDFYYLSEYNERTVAVINLVNDNTACTQVTELVDAKFFFKANNLGSYVFKFWQGEDESGHDMYYTVEVPVVN